MSYQMLIVVAAKNGSSVGPIVTGNYSSMGICETAKKELTERLEAPLPPGETGTQWEYRIECMRKT